MFNKKKATEENSLDNYAQHLFDALQLFRVYESEQKFSNTTRILTGILVILLLSGNFLLIISELMSFKDVKDTRELATRIGPVSLHFTGILKWIFCMSNINKINSLIDSLKCCHHLSSQICQTLEDRERLHREMVVAQRRSKLFIYLWPALGMSGAFHYCCNPLSLRMYEIYVQNHDSANVSKILPIAGWFPWDFDDYFGLSYILQIFGVMGCCVGSVSYDQLYVSTLIIVCSYLRHLISSLHSQTEDLRKNRDTDFERRLKNCAIQYAQVLNYVEDMERVGSPCMFVQCVQNIIVLCLTSFEAATLEITSDAECILKILTMGEFATAVTIQLFFFCLIATHVKTLGLLVADAAYSCEWVSSLDKEETFSKKHEVKYLVLMITVRAQRPILLTGGPFYVLSLETFKAIVGLAISNAVILSQLYKEK